MSRAAVLLVCQGNLYRSPAAAAMLRGKLQARGDATSVSSAGFGASALPCPERVVRAMNRRGFDLSEHRTRSLDAAMIDEAALVLGMERWHVHEVVSRDPGARSRTFTLLDLVARAHQFGPRPASTDIATWLATFDPERPSIDRHGRHAVVDVPDPSTRGWLFLRRVLGRLDRAVIDLVDLVVAPGGGWPPPRN